jgi:SSS family transporter
MNFLDWVVVLVYLAVIVGIALYLNRHQHNTEDYYLGGRKIKWWQSGASTMATQLGAISFVSAPAFVALKSGGGLKWLCYEFAVPLSLILVMAIIIPIFHQSQYISIYEYLEKRFDQGTRTTVSLFFQIGRGLATAVAVLAGGLILSTALGIATPNAIFLIGIVTVIYDALGGIRVVILSDFLQMMIIIAGIVICGGAAVALVGFDTAINTMPPERFQILVFNHWGLSEETAYGFWPMLIGGFFLYASYYGTDQSQVQRELSVGRVDDVRRSLMVNALGRFPLVLLYCVMGIFVGAVFLQPEALSRVASAMHLGDGTVKQILSHDPDRMLPMFILSYLPHGVIGFLFVAIMAALMSSLDSGLNSLSAVTMKDFYQRYVRKDGNERHYLVVSKIITLLWGVFCISMALAFYSFGEATRHTTIVLINAVGSMLYGPILASFLLGMFTERIGPGSVKAGIWFGLLINLALWLFTPISWLWWNLTGFAGTCLVAYIFSFLTVKRRRDIPDETLIRCIDLSSGTRWKRMYCFTGLYFIFIILVSLGIQRLG